MLIHGTSSTINARTMPSRTFSSLNTWVVISSFRLPLETWILSELYHGIHFTSSDNRPGVDTNTCGLLSRSCLIWLRTWGIRCDTWIAWCPPIWTTSSLEGAMIRHWIFPMLGLITVIFLTSLFEFSCKRTFFATTVSPIHIIEVYGSVH